MSTPCSKFAYFDNSAPPSEDGPGWFASEHGVTPGSSALPRNAAAHGDLNMSLLLTTVFPLGPLVATSLALERILYEEIEAGLRRHALGSWGAICHEDKLSNDYAVRHGERIPSAYWCTLGFQFWIITEGDRSATTVLLPQEY